jgi:hypothetical protein
MSWLFSQALVAEYSAASCSDGAPSVPSNTTPTPQAFLWRDKTTDAWSRFPSGLTCEPLTDDRGEELLTWFREGFLAKTLVRPAKEPVSTAREAECGERWPESSAKFDQATFSWRTRQCLLFEDLAESLETFPRWGIMRDGELWELATPEHLTSESESGSWPTPEASAHKTDVNNLEYLSRRKRIGKQVGICGELILRSNGGGTANHDWIEWLMGWPIAWTACSALATDKFQQWLLSHGVSSADPDSTQPHT